ncbi:MAG TPA: radical SAM protein [Elusimicrobiota bacterium]|nr:radical SAM protein [Elusimicrobiota bacterium]
MDILFVNPSLEWKADLQKKISIRIESNIPNQESPHIGIAYLLAMAKKIGISAHYIDMVMQGWDVEKLMDFIAEHRPALVGFTAFTIQIKPAGKIAEKIKERFPKTVVCVGGPHAGAVPGETLEEFPGFDFAVCGEGEHLLRRLLDVLGDEKALEKLPGVVTRGKKDYAWTPIEDLDPLPFPAWEEFDLTKYPGTYPHRTRQELPMIVGRGCPFRCTFCCRALGDDNRRRSVRSVLAEIEHNVERFGCESVAFMDETFVLPGKWMDEFLSTYMKRGLHKKVSWSCSTRVSQITPDFLRRMREAGCYYIFYGMESADDATLRLIKKGITVQQIRNAVKWSQQAGIIPVGAFIIGLPGDTEEKIHRAIDLARELNLYSVTFPIAVPFPGTELRDMALKKEYGMRILTNDWDLYGKQSGGVMESDDLSWQKRNELQKIAYQTHPKKKIAQYVEWLEKVKN